MQPAEEHQGRTRQGVDEEDGKVEESRRQDDGDTGSLPCWELEG